MLRNMKIGTKLIFGFLFITLLLGIVGGIGTYSIKNVQNRANSMYNDNLIPTNALSKVEANLLKIRLNVLYILDEDNKKLILQYEKSIKDLVSEDNELLDKYKNSNLSDIGKKQFDDLIEVLDNYREKRTEIIELAKEEKYEKALNSYNENIDIFDHISAKIDVLRNENLIQAENNNHKSEQLSANVIKVTLAITVIASAIAVCLGMYLSNTISKGINKVVNFAEIIGQGDLTQSISINSKDEIGKLAMAFENTKDKLKELLYQINETANTVASNSQELMASTEETSQSLNQVVTTINEMAEGNSAQTEMIANSSEIITSVADSIFEATKYTESSYNKAISSMEFVEKGKKAVGIQVDTSNSNKEISEKIEIAINELAGMADNIQSIVVEINAISEQTKLLSLNATIEAARAGENGRGFSVVADEIRKLSDRTAVSTNEISKIINSVNNKTSLTVTLVKNAIDVVNQSDMATKTTKDSFDKIALSVEDLLKVSTSTTNLLKEINSRSQEVKEQAINMSAVSEEASASMEELSATSEQQLATVETITNSASNLALLSQELMTHVSMFKLENCDAKGNTEDNIEGSVAGEI